VTSTGSRARHRLATPRRPALLPRSANVVAATVGAVLVLGVQERSELPSPRPHPDAGSRAVAALEPVVPAQREGRPAQFAPAPVSASVIAGAHLQGSAPMRALHAVAG
jgi:hypothetical protein